MIKWMIGFALAIILIGFMLDAYSQIIVLDPNTGGSVKDIILMPLPPPTR